VSWLVVYGGLGGLCIKFLEDMVEGIKIDVVVDDAQFGGGVIFNAV
jgi:hypothetical protein